MACPGLGPVVIRLSGKGGGHFPKVPAGRLDLQIHVPAISLSADFRLRFQGPDLQIGQWYFLVSPSVV